MKQRRSKILFEQAKRLIPGGVNSPVRAFRGVGGDPLFISKAKGSKIWDADGQAYIDYVLSWGPMILGHAHPRIVSAVKSSASRGMSFGAPTEAEVQLARLIQKAFPSMERVRMVSSGTEATMSAIRLARGYTGRDKILKFDGGYHGHADSLLVRTGSGGATLGVPDSAGVPADFTRHTLVLPYNDLSSVAKAFEQHGDGIACIIVEPVAGNMGVVPPREGFLEGLRGITKQFGSLLIFDEVITGFRIALGGAQERFGVTPDLTCLGKIIGGGLPVGVYGGRADIMEKVAPIGPVYQAGTLSGNPVAMAAGIAALSMLSKKSVYKGLERIASDLAEGLEDAAKRARVTVVQNRVGSMLSLFFTSRPVVDYATARQSDTRAYSKYFWSMIEQGFYFAPSQFEAAFLSTAHLPSEIDRTVKAAYTAFKKL